MAHRPARGFLVLALAAAVAVLLCRRQGDLALVEGGGDEEDRVGAPGRLRGEAARVARFWEQPHNVRASHGGFGVSSVSQGKDQWQLALSEGGRLDGAGVFASQEGGKGVAYGLEYDSAKSKYSVADSAGVKLKRVALSAATKASDSKNVDWTLQVEGAKGRHFSVTGDKDSVVYDGSFGIEVPVAKGAELRYAFDAKRRAEAGSVLPNWFRHSAGVRYASPAGNVSLSMHQPNPDIEDAPLEYEATLTGAVADARVKGSPTYKLRAAREGGDFAAYEAKLGVKGPEGLTGGLTAAVRGGRSAISAFGEYAAKRTVAEGIEVGGDAKVALTPIGGSEILELHPVGLTASMDLGKLAPSIADAGSSLDMRARYKLGAERPALSATARLNSKRLAALQLDAEASVDSHGKSSGKVKLGAAARGVAAQYEAAAAAGSKTRHAAQVLWPAELKRGGARAYGRLLQSEGDHGGRPRLQLGVQYDFDADVAGRRVRVEGTSAAYDSGTSLLGEDGLSWHDARLNRVRHSAATLRRRIEGSGVATYKWLHQ